MDPTELTVISVVNHLMDSLFYFLVQFIKLYRGLGGNLDLPAFPRAKRERMTTSLSQGCANESSDVRTPRLILMAAREFLFSSTCFFFFHFIVMKGFVNCLQITS